MKVPKTPAQRAASLRERREALGVKQLMVFAHIDDHTAIKAVAADLAAHRATGQINWPPCGKWRS